MPNADDGSTSSAGADKSFVRKANRILPMSVKGRQGNKYEAMAELMTESALTRKASSEVFGMGPSSSAQVPLMYVDPMFDPILLMFPKENLKELNRRLRHYRTFHPIVKNLIGLHSTFPFSDMETRCDDKDIEPYWQDLGDRLNMMQMIVQMSGDYELLGECHAPNTKILMMDGSSKPVCQVHLGDEVITSSGLPGRVKYRTAKIVSETLTGISIDGKKYSWMTGNHPVLRISKIYSVNCAQFRKQDKPISYTYQSKFVKSEELRAGDLVAIPAEIFTSSTKRPLNRVPGYEDIAIVGQFEGMQLLEIKKIKHKRYSGKVYSMEIDGDPTYIADGIIVHNSFHVGNWDDTTEEWENFAQIPPENVEVHRVYVGTGVAYYLKPDEELKKLLNSPKEIDRAVADMLPAEYKDNIVAGRPSHLDNSRVIHYANKPSGYLTRGESPLKAALKYLLAEDKLYMLMLALVERCTFPIKIWKVGSKEQKWMPSKKHLDMLQQKIMESKGSPDYDLIYHAYLDMEYKTGADKHEDLIKWFDWTQKRILIAMNANEAMFAEANPYAKEAMSIKLIMHRYMLQRTLVNNLITQKVWMPVAKKRGYIMRTNSEASTSISDSKMRIPDIKKYAVPKLFWRPSNLISGMQEQEYLLKLREKGDMPAEVINDLLGYDQEKIKSALEKEQGTPLDPRWRKALEELMKNPEVIKQVIAGKKVKQITIPEDLQGKVQGVKPLGRPAMPEDEKKKPPRAMIPNDVVAPRDKFSDKGELPTPKGEELPPAV